MALAKDLFRSGVNLAIVLSQQLERFAERKMSIQRQTGNILELHHIHLCLQTVVRMLQTLNTSVLVGLQL